jgi:hypothetical protein
MAGRRNFNCTRDENVFTAAWLIRDYYQFHVHEGELQPSIPTEKPFLGLAPYYYLATLCRLHCSMCVALDIRAMLT